MLVSTGPLPRGAVYAVKSDGWRSHCQIDGRSGLVRLVTRSGRYVERAVPELAAAAAALDGREAVLDGELIAGDGLPPSFYRLGGRMGASTALAIERGRRLTPVTFVAFDLLWLDGRFLLGDSYRQRRAALDALEFAGPHWVTTPGLSMARRCSKPARPWARRALSRVVSTIRRIFRAGGAGPS
ncbi:MAG: bifunctional non-ous end joining protein LigD [Actinomycetota bacterium]|jgi:bifunctional non-homologous end joining protein LigD|nr:bifunctional non-ous end joining protein LigD [Actinomycetota bacterium]